jgi:ABC-type transport system involved in multi-copper enzyme maturation permease subunit
LLQAETLKLLSRTGARVALVLAVTFGLLGPLLLAGADGLEFEVNGAPFAEWLGLRVLGSTAQLWSLELRNTLVMPVFVMWLSAASLAGEYQARTLREDLLRPVPRWSVLLSKWGALVLWIIATLILAWVPSAIAGVILFGTEGEWATVALGFAASAGTDAALAAMALLVAVAVRNVPATLVGLFLLWALSTAFGWGLSLTTTFLSSEIATGQLGLPQWYGELLEAAGPWLPSEALGAWRGGTFRGEWVWEHFGSLALTIGISLGLSSFILGRSDVP